MRTIGALHIFTLSFLCSGLTKYDSVTFFHMVKSVWHARQASQTADWTLMDSGESLYLAAEKRVFARDPSKKDSAKVRESIVEIDSESRWIGNARHSNSGPKIFQKFKPEVSPKWITLVEVLKECNQEGNIIIVVEEERIRRQLEEVRCHDNRAGHSMSIRSHRSSEKRGAFRSPTQEYLRSFHLAN